MPILLHNIDPEGDTLLILKEPVRELTTWEEEPEPGAWKILYTRPNDNVAPKNNVIPKKGKKKSRRSVDTTETHHNSVITAQTNIVTQSNSNERNNANDTNKESLLPLSDLHEEEAESPIDKDEPEIRYRVSSGQLKLTSEYFRNMFKGKYRETSPDADDGLNHIEAFEWDPDALLTILNIIHARANLVPRVVELTMLVKLAQIVDYYKMGDAVSRDSERWIYKLEKTTVPTYYCQESVMWICISWVFAEAEIFEKMTGLALNQSRGPIQTLDLPIPPHIIEAIEEQRQNSIRAMIEGLHSLLTELRDGQKGCSFACGAMLLGSLMKSMHSNNLLSDLSLRPQTPYPGLSIKGTAANIRCMQSPPWNDNLGNNVFNGYGSQYHMCKLEDLIEPILGRVDLTMTGLKLELFSGSA